MTTSSIDQTIASFEEMFALMRNRMRMSDAKYGPIEAAYPHKADAIKSALQRLEHYHQTHNTEHLLDAANFLLIEALCPRYTDTYFRACSSGESPGIALHNGTQNHGAASRTLVARVRNSPEFT